MTSDHEMKNEEEELEEGEAEASIDDSMLEELSDDPVETDDTEGFGHIKEDAEEEEEEEEKDAGLEEDAEDVDYDSFDDEDHL